jgi:hypothetical protein
LQLRRLGRPGAGARAAVTFGGRALFSGNRSLDVVDARGDGPPQLASYPLLGAQCASVEVSADTAFCATGRHGVERIELPPRP